MLGLKTKILIGAVSFSVIVSLVFWGHVERSGRKAAEIEAEEFQERLKASESARWQEHASSMRIYFNEAQRIKDLENEKDRLASLLADDAIGLRVNATCPSVPESSTPSPRANAAAPRLTDSAKRNYRDLREMIIDQRSQIEGLQQYAKEVQKVCGMVKNPD